MGDAGRLTLDHRRSLRRHRKRREEDKEDKERKRKSKRRIQFKARPDKQVRKDSNRAGRRHVYL